MKIKNILVSAVIETEVYDEPGNLIGHIEETITAKNLEEAETLLNFVRRQHQKKEAKDAVQSRAPKESETVH